MTIGVWGDSITFGSNDSEGLGWVGRLRKTLSFDDYDHLYNFGICGETSEDLLRRFSIEAEAIEPSDIIFAIGINDSKYSGDSDANNVPLSTYRENLDALIAQAKVFTNKIVIVGATKVDEGWRSAKGSRFLNEEIQRYNIVMEEIAGHHSLRFVDMFDILDPAVDLADGLHPNAQGYQKMFEVINSKLNVSI